MANPNDLLRSDAHAVLADAKFGLFRSWANAPPPAPPPPAPPPPAGPPFADGSGTLTPWDRMHSAYLSRAAYRALDDVVLVLPELEALLPDEPQAANPRTSVPASAQAAKARRARMETWGETGSIKVVTPKQGSGRIRL